MRRCCSKVERFALFRLSSMEGNYYKVFITEGLKDKLERVSSNTNVDVDYLAAMCLAVGFKSIAQYLDVTVAYEPTPDSPIKANVCSGEHDLLLFLAEMNPRPHGFEENRIDYYWR